MSNTGFVIGTTPIKDMSEEDLKKAAQKNANDLQAIGAQLNGLIQQMQISTAMLNVINYELDRRVHSIQIAHTIPH
jgi:hypothetical protein